MIVQQLLRWMAGSGQRTGSAAAAVYRSLTTIPKDKDAWKGVYRREVPRTMEELGTMLGQAVDSPPDARLLKVAVVGIPNSGKSTLINTLLNWRVVSVSSKVHTTQVNAKAILNEGSTQLVFLDTPGLVTPEEVSRHGLKRSLVRDAELSLQEADVMAVVHDVSNYYTSNYLHPRVLRLLALHPQTPSILVLNKVDKTKFKHKLLDIARILTEGVVGGRISHVEKNKIDVLCKKKLIKKTLLLEQELKQKNVRENSHIGTTEHNSKKQSSVNMRTRGDIGKAEVWESDGRNSTSEDNTYHGDNETRSFEPRNSMINDSNSRDIKVNESKARTSKVSKSPVFEGEAALTEQQAKVFSEQHKSWPKFQEVFMISALDGTGVDNVRDFLLDLAQPGPWLFSSQVVTDQNPQELAIMAVREKFLDAFPREVPYGLHFSIEYWDLSESEVVNVVVRVGCQRRGMARLMVGSQGSNVGRVAKLAEQELRNTFRTEVRLRINIIYDPSLKKIQVYK